MVIELRKYAKVRKTHTRTSRNFGLCSPVVEPCSSSCGPNRKFIVKDEALRLGNILSSVKCTMIWELGLRQCAGDSGNLLHDGKLIATLEMFPYSAKFNTRSFLHHNVFYPELAFASPGAIPKNFWSGNLKLLSDL